MLRALPAPFSAPAQLGEYVRFVHQASQQLAPAAGGAAGGGAAGGAGGSSAAAKGITRATAPALASLDADGVAALQPALLPDRLQLLLSALGHAVTDPGAKWAQPQGPSSPEPRRSRPKWGQELQGTRIIIFLESARNCSTP